MNSDKIDAINIAIWNATDNAIDIATRDATDDATDIAIRHAEDATDIAIDSAAIRDAVNAAFNVVNEVIKGVTDDD